MLSGRGSVPPVPLIGRVDMGRKESVKRWTFWDTPESDLVLETHHQQLCSFTKQRSSISVNFSDVHPEAGVSPSPGRRRNEFVNGCFGSGLVTYDVTTSKLVQPPARLVTRPHSPKISL